METTTRRLTPQHTEPRRPPARSATTPATARATRPPAIRPDVHARFLRVLERAMAKPLEDPETEPTYRTVVRTEAPVSAAWDD